MAFNDFYSDPPWQGPQYEPTVAGSLSASIGTIALVATATVTNAGGLNQSIGEFALAATGTIAQSGSLSKSIGEFTLIALGDAAGGGIAHTPTSAALATDDSPHTAFVLIVEGYNLGFTDHHDVAAIASAWDDYGWPNIVGGLDPVGTIQQAARPFDAKVQTPSMSFTVKDDDDDTIAAIMLRESNDEAITNQLTNSTSGNMDSDATLLLMDDSSAFPANGTVYVGSEEIIYSLNGGGGLLGGLLRGVRSLWGTDVDPFFFGQPHRVDFNPDPMEPAVYAPLVSTVPRHWTGRNVALYLCVNEDGVWKVGAEAEMLWAGTIRTIDDEDGTLRLECDSILKRLEGTLMRRQFRGYLEEGMYVDSSNQGSFRVRVVTLDPNAGYQETTDIVTVDDVYTHEDIADAINTQLATWFNGSGTDFPATAELELTLQTLGNGDYYQFRFRDTAGTHALVGIDMDASVARLLGFRDPSSQSWQRLTIGMNTGESAVDGDYVTSQAQWQPLFAALPSFPDDDGGSTTTIITVTDVVTGTAFEPQPASTMPAQWSSTPANGFLRIGGKHIVAVEQLTATTFKWYGRVGHELARLGVAPADGSAMADAEYGTIDGASTAGIVVEQIWLETGYCHEVFLRLLMSTGTPGYNSDDWDVYPEQMGLGLPYRLIDVSSFSLLGADQYVLFVDKPKSFLPLLESAMQRRNLHAFFHRGKIKVTGFGESATASLRLTEETKMQAVGDGGAFTPVTQISRVARTTDFLVNRMKLRYNLPLGSHNGAQPSSIVINNTASQTDLKIIAPVSVDAIGLYDGVEIIGTPGLVAAWEEDFAALALAYFGQHLCIFTITYGLNLMAELYPGRQALVSCASIFHPRTGTRGVTDLPCWCIATRTDFDSDVGEADMIFNPWTVA